MAVAALCMYTEPAAVSHAYQQLAKEVARRLGVGLDVTPTDFASLWHHPQLLLAQTCGYPWATQLREQTRLVATPQYTFPGCEGLNHCSFILVAKLSPAKTLADLKGQRVVINGRDSNSGMNLLRNAVAPLATEGRFFGKVIESGSHLNSMRLLQQGQGDVASVDAVTYGYLHRDVPSCVMGLRVLQRTRQSPALPLITAKIHNDEMILALRDALTAILVERAELAETLGLRGFEAVGEETYLRVLTWEDEAISCGYPVIA